MKNLLLSSSLAAALVAAPIHAADAPAPPVVAKPSEVMDAMLSMARELQSADLSKRPMRERLDAMAEFRHGPGTAQKLRKIFDTERPWTLALLPVSNGRYDYVGTLAPLHYTTETGETYDWTPLTLKISLDKASRNMTMHGAWPSVTGEDKNLRFSMRDMSLKSKQRRGAGDLWLGDVEMNIGSVAFESKGSTPSVMLEDIRVRSAVIERPKAVDINYSFGVKAIGVAGVNVDNFKFAMRMTNVDKAAMAEMDALSKKANAGATPEQRVTALQPVFKAMGKAVIQRGTAIEIDELSAAYKGNTASVKGRITVEGATEADLGALPALLKKVVARFSIRVPAALLRDIATVVADKQASAQAKGPANPQTVAQMSQSVYDIMIGKMVGNGYARIEKDVLLSEIEIRGGVLRINGKEVALPKMPADQPKHSVLQARRIESRCVMPDYPEELVRGDMTWTMSIRYIVKADGTVGNLELVKPSPSPAYDQALLAAMEHCVYIPMLVDGKPVDFPMTREITAAPNAKRP